jgi:hypothetical protein
VDFWKTTWRSKRDLLSWDLPAAAIIAVLVGLFIDNKTIHDTGQVFLLTAVGALAALLGVIIAGLAIVAALLSDEFAAVLARSRSGIAGDLWPFWLVTALCILGIVIAAGSALFMPQLHYPAMRVLIAAAVFVSSYAFFAAMNLVSLIVLQGGNRAKFLSTRRDPDRP